MARCCNIASSGAFPKAGHPCTNIGLGLYGPWGGSEDGNQDREDARRGERDRFGVRLVQRLCGGGGQERDGRQDGHGPGDDHGHAGSARQGGRRRLQLSSDQRQLLADAFSSGAADHHVQRAQPAAGVDFPDRHHRHARDLADRGQRRDVRHHGLRPRLRAEREDRRADVGIQAQDGSGHDLLLRPQQSRRRGLRRQRLSRHARLASSSRSTPRPAR